MLPTTPNAPPLVSIITIVLNDSAHIKQALESGLGQTYPAIEYIVKDGGSTDGTLDILESYHHRLAACLVQADQGISDAWNQALEQANGQFVVLLNSDDQLAPGLVESAVNLLSSGEADIVFGNTLVVDPGSGSHKTIIGRWRPSRLWQGIGFLHPGVVCSRDVYRRIGNFDCSLRYAMDADWLIRAHKAGYRFKSHGQYSTMANSGVSNVQWLKARREYLGVLKKHGLSSLSLLLGQIWLLLLRFKKPL